MAQMSADMPTRKSRLVGVAIPVELNDLPPIDGPSRRTRRGRSENVQLHEMVGIHQLSQAVALTIDPEVILDRVADAALSQFGADEISILLPTADASELYVAAVRGKGRDHILGERVPISWGVAGWVARNRKGLRIDGGIDDARFTPVVSRPDIHSAISMPMIVGGHFVGVLNVSTTRRRQFTLGQVRALSILSSTAAAALEHAHLHAEARGAEAHSRAIAERLAAMNSFAKATASTLDESSLYAMALAHVAELTGCIWCSITQHEKEADQLRLVAVWGDERVGIPVGTPIDVQDSASGLVLRTGAAHVVQDTRASPPEMKRQRQLAEQGILARITVPITIGGSTWGTVGVGFSETGAATSDRVEFLEGMASHLAVAIHNAELYTQLHSAYDQLKQAQDQIVQQERMRALGQMASGIAHDFNNALVPVLGFSELLLTEPTAIGNPERVRRGLEMIRTGAQDAAKMVGRLREFYRRREAGEFFQPVNVGQLIEQVISLTRPRWRDQALALGVTIHVEADLEPNLPLISGNEAELREAIMNLVFNAVDAMPSSGRLILKARSNGPWVEVDVADSGCGMTEFVREHCQEPLFSTKGEHGTGLGLAMVYGIIQRHEGTIDIKTELGVGTTVRVRLPTGGLLSLDDETAEAPLGTRQLHVLVVDDQPVVREVLEGYLASDGHLVQCAASGPEALRLFQEHRFDLVLTDRGMPEMSGDDLAQALKAQSPQTPIILLTGFGELMRAAGEQPAGVDLVVAKPVELGHLRAALARLVPGSSGVDKDDPSQRDVCSYTIPKAAP